MLIISKKLAIILSIALIALPGFLLADEASDAIQDLNAQIENKRKEADSLKNDINKFRQKINRLQNESESLKTRLNILDTGINRTKKEIQLSRLQIEETELEIKDLNKQIDVKGEQIEKKKEEIKELLQRVNNLNEDYVSNEETENNGVFDLLLRFIKIVIKYESWADYSSTLDSSKKINKALANNKKYLEELKQSLEQTKDEQEQKQDELEKEKDKLEKKKKVLGEEQTSKTILLEETQANETKYQALLKKSVAREQALSSQITKLEKEMIERLRALNASNPFATMIWPVPRNIITTQFGGPGYRQAVHNAIDIRAAVGTPVVAPANGIVTAAVTRNNNACRTVRWFCDYTYVRIAHTEEVYSFLLHLSSITVSEGQEVKAGDIVGYSGGAPKQPGTGYFIYPSVPASTGPHLHFAVIKNGVPVNPLNYLP